MQYTEERYHLEVEITVKECNIPPDELARMQRLLEPLGEAVEEFTSSQVSITVIRHPRSGDHHVAARLTLPTGSVSAEDRDTYLDSAFQRCVARLVPKVQEARRRPRPPEAAAAERLTALDRDVVAPEDPDAGPLGEAVRAGDYRPFRLALAGYEEWLRNRVGRWVQRFPEAEARVGRRLRIGDLVEQVYLNAFESFLERPTDLRLSDWLERLIDPSLKALLRHPDEEGENASLARTLRELPLGEP
jgi:hypothetical protein